jgi:hypothetical protein
MQELSKEALEEFSRGLAQNLGYLGTQGVYSLSLGWFPGPPRGDHFRLHVRLTPRLYIAPQVWCTDAPTLSYLYREPFMIRTPEELARRPAICDQGVMKLLITAKRQRYAMLAKIISVFRQLTYVALPHTARGTKD